jgi:hypothetical protein
MSSTPPSRTPKNRDELIELLAKHDGVLVGRDGTFRLTSSRRTELTHWFALAGIDLAKLRTIDEYIAARERAAPYFDDWMRQVARRGAASLERDLLIACIEGDDARIARLKLRMANSTPRDERADPDTRDPPAPPDGSMSRR